MQVTSVAAEIAAKPKATQVAILLHTAGPEALDIHSTFTFLTDDDGETEDKNDVDTILQKFRKYCQPRKNVVFERYKFWERSQKDAEAIDHFVTDLKKRATTCEFGEQKDLMIRDKLIFGVRDQRVKERLLREGDLSLARHMPCR